MAPKATDQQLEGIRRAVARLKAAEEELEAARADLAREIGDALKDGVRPVDVEDEVPYKREHIRRIAREQGVPPSRRTREVATVTNS
jgi:CO/xanthine dehydrogenase FAD-binding subunit